MNNYKDFYKFQATTLAVVDGCGVSLSKPRENAEKIVKCVCDSDAAVVVFPELALTGSTCGDFFFDSAFLDELDAATRAVCDGLTKAHGKVAVIGLPFAYVRSKAKEHGTGSLIEGEIVGGQRVVVIEDLVSTGKSSIQAIHALKDAGLSVAGLVSIFTYGFDIADENFKEAKCRYSSLSNYTTLIQYAAEHSFIGKNDIDLLDNWRKDPANWGKEQEQLT